MSGLSSGAFDPDGGAFSRAHGEASRAVNLCAASSTSGPTVARLPSIRSAAPRRARRRRVSHPLPPLASFPSPGDSPGTHTNAANGSKPKSPMREEVGVGLGVIAEGIGAGYRRSVSLSFRFLISDRIYRNIEMQVLRLFDAPL